MSDLFFTAGTEPETWEWSVYGEVYNPSQPISNQEFNHVILDLSSDIGPVQIGGEAGESACKLCSIPIGSRAMLECL